MKTKKLIILLLFVVIFSSVITYISHKNYYRDLDKLELEMDLVVTSQENEYGVNVDTDAIHFGMLPLKGGSTRHFNITNSHDFMVKVFIEKDSSLLSGIVDINPKIFILKPDGVKEIDAVVSVPSDFDPGNYSGKITIMTKAPLFKLD